METTDEKAWFEKGVFNFFKFTPDVKREFTIDPKASLVVRKELKMKLSALNVENLFLK